MSFVKVAEKYAEDVKNKKILTSKWVKMACNRFQKDLKSKKFTFDSNSAERVCKFIELLPHIKGKWDTKTIKLQPWQVFILVNAFGFKNKDGNRRFRTIYIEVPRKNGKSSLSSAVALYMLTSDSEQGAEVYSCATTRDQAKIVFNDAKMMCKKTPALCKAYGVNINAHNIHILDTASKFESLSSEADTLDGLNIHFACLDELHAHRTREVFDVIETSTGSRKQSLIWLISTAGSNRAGICYEQRTYVSKILQEVIEDDTYFGIIHTIDDGDDWRKAASWRKANPNYGISVLPEDIKRLATKAYETPSAQNTFLTKRLNVWVSADSSWLNMAKLELCVQKTSINDFLGAECWIGLDLASKVDIAAMAILFAKENTVYCFMKFYLPSETVSAGANSQYEGWVAQGLLTETEGAVINFGDIEDDMKSLARNYKINSVSYDPFQATQFSQRMLAEGFPMVEMRPTVLNFSEPMKHLEALVYEKKFAYDGNPVLTWMFSNVVSHRDNKDNIYPKKERDDNKIDGVVAIIMGLNRLIANYSTKSKYEEGDLFVL